ncbi:MAG: Maf family nucleotide pyrophosphatase [Burkholderiaceae bacterium]|jgi:septum formation protein|nr:Maf family nucleotide pyrophosphatase [Burkholderiaceae bacterium]MDH5207017.1 Maf family nucleotide pyrophosphatase [Burkholderiaceae bacterium]
MPSSIYLASRSPRRRDLLKQLGVKFDPLLLRLSGPRGADVDETQHAGESPADYVERTAREKAAFGLQVLGMRTMLQRPVLAADTVVIVDGDVLGKPADREQAAAFLRRLSGRVHEVRTAVALAMEGPLMCETSVSLVSFRELAEDEILRYCATPEPYDKAGGYGIQGLAALFIERIEGSYTGVMGLPLFETGRMLTQAGIKIL